MRKYRNQEENQELEIYCNCCGRRIKTQKDMIVEGVFHGQVQWGYFSGKDGESHSFDLCETCYDKWISAFQIPVERNLENELL